jgi:hypothetical protein
MSEELPDTAGAMERKDTAHVLPTGWLLLALGLIVWGAWYLYTYSPWGGGWTQAGAMESTPAESGGNVLMTILFTALPTAAALGLYLAQRRRRS